MRFASAKPLHGNVVPILYMGHVHRTDTALRADVLANKAVSTLACACQLWTVLLGMSICPDQGV